MKGAFGKQAWVMAASLAIVAAMPTGASATPTFQINPNSLPLIGSTATTFTASDINGTSDALIQQTGPTTQFEQGWINFSGFTNNGVNVGSAVSGLVTQGSIGAGPATYQLYATFTATVQGISGFGPGQVGTIAPGAFNFIVRADPGSTNVFSPGSTS